MYIVRDKKTKEIIHVNPAPLSQELEGVEVYFKFDPDTMEIGKTNFREIPERFDINEIGEIIEISLTLQEKVEAGIIILKPEEKIVGSQIVEKTLSEKVAEGLMTLLPTQKIVGEGPDEQIVEKTFSEKVAEGLITLPPTQKIVGEGTNEQIVEKTFSERVAEGLITLPPTRKIVGEGTNEQIVGKTLSEQVAEGLIELAPNQKLVGEAIVEKTTREMFDEGLITLDQVKQERIQYYSDLAFEKRASIIPDYKLQNVALGIYDAQTTANYKATVQAFRDEFYRIKARIEQAETIEAVEAITENFPRELVVAH